MMIGGRSLRNRVVVLEKSNKDLNKNCCSYKRKLSNEKENQFMNPRTKRQCNGKEQRKCKLNQSTLKDMKNWPLTDVISNKENNDTHTKRLSLSQGNENQCVQSSRREVVKQKCTLKNKSKSPLKESNANATVGTKKGFKKKITVTSNTNKQKQNVSDLKITISKEYKEPVNKTQSKKKLVYDKSEKLSAGKNLNIKTKPTKQDISFVKHASNFPIWKKYPNVSQHNQSKKLRSSVDVYDIALDEDLMSSEVEVKKKKKIVSKKKNVDSGKSKKKHSSISTTHPNYKKKMLSSDNYLKLVDKRPRFETNHIGSNMTNTKLAAVENEILITVDALSRNKNNVICDLVDENNMPNLASSEDDIIEVLETDSDLPASDPKPENDYMSNLADELERSFMMPRMTSTPNAVHLKATVQTQKGNMMSKVPDVPSITNMNCLNTFVDTPSDSPCDDNAGKEIDDGIGDITFFESPTKQEKKAKKGNQKTLQTQKGNMMSKVPDVPSITNMNCLNTFVDTPSDSPCDDNAGKEIDDGIGDITLFESPKKQKKKPKKGNQKTLQINLFGEICNSPFSVDSFEDSILMSNKAYHTPDNFKTHLVQAKRVSDSIKEPKKSKQDILIEKLAQHFNEIGDTELCVE